MTHALENLKREPLSIGNVDEVTRSFKEVKYVCSNNKCGHTQVLRFFATDVVLPVTCCVKCRAGFGLPNVGLMMSEHKGMFPDKVEVVQG
jgi:hypothetical protein